MDVRAVPAQHGRMLSYQHAYHAGNHADALKHVMLGEIIAGMQHKQAPLFMLDAFASRGCYDLRSPEALKNREFDTGIGRLWGHRDEAGVPAGIRRWFGLIDRHNPQGGFRHLPGSTALLADMRRDRDRLAACDLHPQEFEALRRGFASGRRLALHRRDAFEALRALLPPKEKRGLIFLDPSYERKQEYRDIADAVIDAARRFATGVYVVWYPLLPEGRQQQLFDRLQRSGLRKILRVELDCRDCPPGMRMHGSGLLIVRPPWHAMQAMRASLGWLHDALAGDHGRFDWLVPE